MEGLKNQLIKLRKEINQTQEQVSLSLNLAPTTYKNYEYGACEPSIETLIKLADYYNVSLDYLVGREFANEVGYLSKQDNEFVKAYLNLTEENKIRLHGYLMCLVGMN